MQGARSVFVEEPVYGPYSEGLQKCSVSLKVPYLSQSQKIEHMQFTWITVRGTTTQSTGPVEITKITPKTGIIYPGSRMIITLTIPKDIQPKAGDSFTLKITPETGAPAFLITRLPEDYTGGIIEIQSP